MFHTSKTLQDPEDTVTVAHDTHYVNLFDHPLSLDLSAYEEGYATLSRSKKTLWRYLPKQARDGKLYPAYRVHYAGRLTSTNPILIQSLPRALRACICDPGRVIVVTDWTASHLRIAIEESGDEPKSYEELIPWLQGHGIDDPQICRKVAKLSVQIWLNGGTGLTITKKARQAFGVKIKGTEMVKQISQVWPKVAAWKEAKSSEIVAAGYELKTKARTRTIPDGTNRDGLDRRRKSALVGCYLQAVEADAFYRVLDYIVDGWEKKVFTKDDLYPLIPLHDGIVWSVRADRPDLKKTLRNLMLMAIGHEGEEGYVTVTSGPSWGEQSHEWRPYPEDACGDDEGGKKKAKEDPPTRETAIKILESGDFWLDTTSHKPMLRDTPVDDALYLELAVAMSRARSDQRSYAVQTIAEAVAFLCNKKPRNPIKEHLEQLVWDGVPRVDTWLTTYLGVEDSESTRLKARTWMLGAARRGVRPGAKQDLTLMLKGEQGIGKTRLVRALALKSAWAGQLSRDMTSKDALMILGGVFLVELPELSAMSRAKTEDVKDFLTTTVDRFRPPYGKTVVEVPRSCSFIGTTNESTPLKDSTGNRRFLIVDVPGVIDVEALTEDAPQLWAEAVQRVQQGERCYLTMEEQKLLKPEQEESTVEDSWAEDVLTYARKSGYGGMTMLTTRDLLKYAIGKETSQISRWDEMRVAAIMRNAGYTQKRKLIDGRGKIRMWVRDGHPEDEKVFGSTYNEKFR
ncbi:MAG: hypothetical protein D6722_25070 [Bacteroidetes bacterium]|nr:MAG: hypothetical protein D6722_25070 [Bacteroidota bacterium]